MLAASPECLTWEEYRDKWADTWDRERTDRKMHKQAWTQRMLALPSHVRSNANLYLSGERMRKTARYADHVYSKMVDAENILQVEGPCESNGLGHMLYLDSSKLPAHLDIVDDLDDGRDASDQSYTEWVDRHKAILEPEKDYKDVWWESLLPNDPTEMTEYPGDDAIPDMWGPVEKDETGRERVNPAQAKTAKFGWRTAEVLRNNEHDDNDIRLLEDAMRRDIIVGHHPRNQDRTRVGVEFPVPKSILKNVPPDWILEYLEMHKPDMLITQDEKEEKAKAEAKASDKQKAGKTKGKKRERRLPDSYSESKPQGVFFETMKKDIQKLSS